MKTLAEKAYALLKQVPAGRVTTYKEIARALDTRAYRAIGQAMRNNPYAPQVPCHRVVAASGRIGGFQGKTTGAAIQKKIQMLRDEGVEVSQGRIKDFETMLFRFT